MQKLTCAPREGWMQIVEQSGLIWHSSSDEPYWNEDSYYVFSSNEIAKLEKAGNACYNLLLEAGDYIAQRPELLYKFGIPEAFHPMIFDSWNDEPPALNYGRFDFGWDGNGEPKLFEFNCDTPTSLLEASIIQWNWKEDKFPDNDQFNGIHEALVAKWKDIRPYLPTDNITFTHIEDDAGEDSITVSYMRDIAEEAGFITDGIIISDIGWDGRDFVDLENNPIEVLQHLYPWEWLVNESFGKYILENDRMRWIEPIWKMMWSNKAILPILTEIAPNHPNILNAYYEPKIIDPMVKKPILAREGANITIFSDEEVHEQTDGDYGDEGFIYQDFYPLPNFKGKYPVLGVWMVEDEAVGMGIREDGLITGNLAKFVPHIIDS